MTLYGNERNSADTGRSLPWVIVYTGMIVFTLEPVTSGAPVL